MILRTEIDIPRRQPFTINHDDEIVMLGSCFTDNVGRRLDRDGFAVTYNPMGTLYNPASIYNAIHLALANEEERKLIIRQDNDEKWHCLNFAARYLYSSYEELHTDINQHLDSLGESIRKCSTIFITLGTAYVFRIGKEGIVGNCHKFPGCCFERTLLTLDESTEWIKKTIEIIGGQKNIIFTISPIRHTADGFHGNQLSKATLLLAVDNALGCTEAFYFPSYEIILDDLRDYRFYADDMKHPSEVAVDYIYEIFMKYYMTPATIEVAIRARKEFKRSQHRQIIN